METASQNSQAQQVASLASAEAASQSKSTDKKPEALGFVENIAVVGSIILIILSFPLTLWFCYKQVQEYERAVILRLGRFKGKASGPGLFFTIPCLDTFRVFDLRTIWYDIPVQLVVTKDSMHVGVDAVLFYRVFDPVKAMKNVAAVDKSTRLLATTTLRNVLGTFTLAEILSDKMGIAQNLQGILDEATDPWGVLVERVEIKSVILPDTLTKSLAAEAEATRLARAKVIAAEGELGASKALAQASDGMMGSSITLQLRYLQTLSAIGTMNNNTVVFPIPMELIKHWTK